MLDPAYLRTLNFALHPIEREKYSELVTVLRDTQGYSEHTEYFANILTSEAYSLPFKKKLVLGLPFLQQGRLWAYSNLEGEALYGFVVTFLRDAPRQFDKKDIEVLVTNPTLTSYSDKGYDVVGYLLARLSSGIFPDDYKRAAHFVTCLIERDLMTLRIAEEVLTINASIQAEESWLREPYGELPLITWARSKYDLETLPDSWVIKFLSTA